MGLHRMPQTAVSSVWWSLPLIGGDTCQAVWIKIAVNSLRYYQSDIRRNNPELALNRDLRKLRRRARSLQNPWLTFPEISYTSYVSYLTLFSMLSLRAKCHASSLFSLLACFGVLSVGCMVGIRGVLFRYFQTNY